MTAGLHSERCERLTAILPNLKRCAHGQWETEDGKVKVGFVSLNENDGYLCIETPAALPAGVNAWDWHTRALSLPVGTKLAHDVLRAEAVLSDEEADLGGRVSRLWGRFQVAQQLLGGTGLKEETGATPPAPDLARLCADAKWPYTPRAEGRVAVPLEAGPVPVTAIVEFAPPRLLRVAADVLESDMLSELSRQAMGELLLRLCKLVRLVRAGVLAQENLITVRLEVALDAGASAAELGHALGVLSVACRMCVAELEALQDEAVAREVTTHTPGKPTTETAVIAGKEEP